MAVAEVEDTEIDVAGLPYRFAIVPLKHLFTDAYQRPLTSFVEKIESHFNPALVGTLAVSERSKTKFAVIDGQTRAEGMRRAGKTEAPCLVYHGLSQAEEAALFSLFQTERRGMTSANRFNAQVVAKDPTALAINEILEGLGFEIGVSSARNVIGAVAAVEYCYHGARTGLAAKKIANAELLVKVLETIKGAWPTLPDTAKSAQMIRGLGFFLANQGKDLSDANIARLVARLSKVQPSELATRAQQLREGRGMSANSPAYLAEAIEAQYRKQQR